MAEVVRGGLQAIPRGQMEAALSLGMTPMLLGPYAWLLRAFDLWARGIIALLLDIAMPGLDGVDVVMLLRLQKEFFEGPGRRA